MLYCKAKTIQLYSLSSLKGAGGYESYSMGVIICLAEWKSFMDGLKRFLWVNITAFDTYCHQDFRFETLTGFESLRVEITAFSHFVFHLISFHEEEMGPLVCWLQLQNWREGEGGGIPKKVKCFFWKIWTLLGNWKSNGKNKLK